MSGDRMVGCNAALAPAVAVRCDADTFDAAAPTAEGGSGQERTEGTELRPQSSALTQIRAARVSTATAAARSDTQPAAAHTHARVGAALDEAAHQMKKK